MKYSIPIFLLAFIGFSCSEDDIEELLTTDTTFTASETFDIDIDIDKDEPLTYTEAETIEASVNGVDITEVEILNISATISNVVAPEPVNLTTASLTFEGTGVAPFTFGDVELVNGTSLEISFDNIPQTVLDTFEAKLLADEEITVVASATVDGAPINFSLTLSVEIKATGTVG